jgi:hypothetical protein
MKSPLLAHEMRVLAISILEGANMPQQALEVKLNYADCLEKLGKGAEASELRKKK